MRAAAGFTILVCAASFVHFEGLHGQQSATLSFTDITGGAGLDQSTGSHGAMFADLDQDGLPELYVTYNDIRFGFRENRFYRNLGGAFVEEAAARGIANFSGGSHGAAWADMDNDGDFDMLVSRTFGGTGDPPPPAANRVLRNDGGRFVDITPPAVAGYADYTRAMLAFDMDRDGLLDIFAVNGDRGSGDPGDRNELYRNDGGMRFRAIGSSPAVEIPSGQGATDTDYDGDGDVDLIVANRNGDLAVLRNDGGSFRAVTPASIGIVHGAGMGITSGDLDNDGNLDLILIQQNFGSPPERYAFVYRNVGGGNFQFMAQFEGFGGFTAGLADLDNDGDLDLIFPGYPLALLNRGDGTFVGGPGYPGPLKGIPVEDPRTVAFADIDGDGDVDFLQTAKGGRPFLIRNNFNGGNWLKVRLASPHGQAGAFGAKVRVLRAGSGSLIALREARSSSGYLAQDDPLIHVGLGSASTVDVEVTFLDGTRVTRTNVSSNQTLTVTGAGSVGLPGAPRNLAASVAGSGVTLRWDAATTGDAAREYIVEAGSVSGASNLAILATGTLATVFTASAPPGTYYVRVKGRNGAGAGSPSNEVIVRIGTGATAPQAPVGFTFTRAGSLVTLRWSAPPQGDPPTSFVIEVGSQPGTSDLVVIENGAAMELAAIAPPGRYFVRVRGRNAGGLGAASSELEIAVDDSR
jgi:enediyne biosynthesis protein E4